MSAHCSRALDALREKCPCLQSAGGFVAVMCLFACFHQMVTSGLISSILSTLELRYGLTSVQSGTLLSIYDFVKLCLVIPVSYIGGKGHIPRNMAVCCFILALGMFLFISAELFSARYVPDGGSATDTCTSTMPPCVGSSTSGFYYLLLFGQGLMALGGTAPYCIGPAYILSNSEPKKALAFMGMFYAAAAFGPAVGFLGGGALLSGWVDPSGLPPGFESLTTSDPRWVGNWWAGILIAGIAVLLLIPFFLVMPKRMPTAPAHEMHDEVAGSVGDAWIMGKAIFTNPQWWLVTLAVTSEAFAVSGYTGFGPKYMQTQFGLQAGTAGILAGGGVVPAAVIGMFTGGWWDGKRHTKLSQTAIFNTKFAAISTVLVLIITAIGCDNVPVQGVSLNPPYALTLNQGCNAACVCDKSYAPICGSDKISYFNPCYAGCANYSIADSQYQRCSCVGAGSGANVTSDLTTATAVSGTCDADCGAMLGVFMLFFFLFLLGTFMNHTPSTAILMRLVPVSHKSMSLGMNDAIYKLLGTIPGPLAFGSVFDSSCIITAAACGADTGSCVLYDSYRLRLLSFLVLGGVFKCLSVTFNLLSVKSIRSKEIGMEAEGKLTSYSPAEPASPSNSKPGGSDAEQQRPAEAGSGSASPASESTPATPTATQSRAPEGHEQQASSHGHSDGAHSPNVTVMVPIDRTRKASLEALDLNLSNSTPSDVP